MDDQHTVTNQPPRDWVTDIPARDIIAAWRSDFDIDVAYLFEGIDTVQLLRDSHTGQLSFDPPVMGDTAFYQALRTKKWYHPKAKEEFRHVAQARARGEHVLDVGCGLADFAGYMPANFYRGLETDAEAVKQAQRNGLDVHHMDLATYRASDLFEPAEMVTAFQVLEHLADPDVFVARMVACTRPGGRIVLSVPDGASFLRDLPDFMLNAPPHHVYWWNESSLKALAARHVLKGITFSRFQVEPWEKQLWWMASLARIGRKAPPPLFGARWRARKVASYIGSLALQAIPVPASAKGSTLVMTARVPA